MFSNVCDMLASQKYVCRRLEVVVLKSWNRQEGTDLLSKGRAVTLGKKKVQSPLEKSRPSVGITVNRRKDLAAG